MDRTQQCIWDVEAETEALMGVGIMAPLHRIMPIPAEAEQPRATVHLVLGLEQSLANSGIRRSGGDHLEGIVERVDRRDLEPSPLNIREAELPVEEVIDAHLGQHDVDPAIGKRTESRAPTPERRRRAAEFFWVFE